MANLLHPLTPLGHAAPEVTSIGPVTITENTGVALASLATRRGREADVATAAQAAGIPQPGPGQAEKAALYGAIWLGEQQWMIEAPFETHEDIAAILKPIFGDAASITEQTDAWVRFDVVAPDLAALFERLCNYDLRSKAPGSATRTVIDHLGCYVVLRAPELVSVIGPRSSAHALRHALITAAKSVF